MQFNRDASGAMMPSPRTEPGRVNFHFSAHVDASTAYVVAQVVK